MRHTVEKSHAVGLYGEAAAAAPPEKKTAVKPVYEDKTLDRSYCRYTVVSHVSSERLSQYYGVQCSIVTTCPQYRITCLTL